LTGWIATLQDGELARASDVSTTQAPGKGSVAITVGVLNVATDGGKVRKGLCSNYLACLRLNKD